MGLGGGADRQSRIAGAQRQREARLWIPSRVHFLTFDVNRAERGDF